MLKLRQTELAALQAAAASSEVETCAAGLVWAGATRGHEQDYLVRELAAVPEAAYSTRTAVAATLKPEFCFELASRATARGAGVVLAHTHVGQHPLDKFSVVDDGGEPALAAYFQRRLPGKASFTLLATARGVVARHIGPGDEVDVVSVGRDLRHAKGFSGFVSESFDRQVRAFGKEGQLAIGALNVAIVGLGGTGSVVAQQLAHLGVRRFILIDPDTVESTNLNRLVGASTSDVGRVKVEVARANIARISDVAQCELVVGDVTRPEMASALTQADFIFGCTDSMASRAVLNQLAYQYYIPCIDMGVAIGTNGGAVTHMVGRVQMLSPELPCLVCADKLDADQVRRELMTEQERSRDQYIIGEQVHQPAVISLNSQVASAAVTMFLSAVAGIPARARMLTFDAMRGAVSPVVATARPHCIVCSPEGALAQGGRWTLPTRGGAR